MHISGRVVLLPHTGHTVPSLNVTVGAHRLQKCEPSNTSEPHRSQVMSGGNSTSRTFMQISLRLAMGVAHSRYFLRLSARSVRSHGRLGFPKCPYAAVCEYIGLRRPSVSITA